MFPVIPTSSSSSSSNVTVNVNVEGSLLTQDDIVKVVNDAVVTANTQGLSVTRPGGLPAFE
jgi:aspartate carbamoyltransferase regulatory subunit